MATLGLFYFTSKHNASARSRISHLPIDQASDASAIAGLVGGLQALSNGGVTEDSTHPRFKVYGVTRNLINIEAVDEVIQGQDLTNEPLGVNGYLLGDMTGLPVFAKVRQPFNLKGINENFTLPEGYDDTDDVSNAVRQFLIKWGKVRYMDGSDLEGRAVTSVVITSVFKMH